jgi:CDP-diglyceride synthetase
LIDNDYNSGTIIYTYLLLGILLIIGAWLTRIFNFKKHFKFSYQHYGIHVTYIVLLAGYFHYYDSAIAVAFMLGILFLSAFMYKEALKDKSFYFLLLVVLYSYIAASSLVVRLFIQAEDIVAVYLLLFYFIGSGIGLTLLLINLNKKLKPA